VLLWLGCDCVVVYGVGLTARMVLTYACVGRDVDVGGVVTGGVPGGLLEAIVGVDVTVRVFVTVGLVWMMVIVLVVGVGVGVAGMVRLCEEAACW
jgi:hypothetical protein